MPRNMVLSRSSSFSRSSSSRKVALSRSSSFSRMALSRSSSFSRMALSRSLSFSRTSSKKHAQVSQRRDPVQVNLVRDSKSRFGFLIGVEAAGFVISKIATTTEAEPLVHESDEQLPFDEREKMSVGDLVLSVGATALVNESGLLLFDLDGVRSLVKGAPGNSIVLTVQPHDSAAAAVEKAAAAWASARKVVRGQVSQRYHSNLGQIAQQRDPVQVTLARDSKSRFGFLIGVEAAGFVISKIATTDAESVFNERHKIFVGDSVLSVGATALVDEHGLLLFDLDGVRSLVTGTTGNSIVLTVQPRDRPAAAAEKAAAAWASAQKAAKDQAVAQQAAVDNAVAEKWAAVRAASRKAAAEKLAREKAAAAEKAAAQKAAQKAAVERAAEDKAVAQRVAAERVAAAAERAAERAAVERAAAAVAAAAEKALAQRVAADNALAVAKAVAEGKTAIMQNGLAPEMMDSSRWNFSKRRVQQSDAVQVTLLRDSNSQFGFAIGPRNGGFVITGIAPIDGLPLVDLAFDERDKLSLGDIVLNVGATPLVNQRGLRIPGFDLEHVRSLVKDSQGASIILRVQRNIRRESRGQESKTARTSWFARWLPAETPFERAQRTIVIEPFGIALRAQLKGIDLQTKDLSISGNSLEVRARPVKGGHFDQHWCQVAASISVIAHALGLPSVGRILIEVHVTIMSPLGLAEAQSTVQKAADLLASSWPEVPALSVAAARELATERVERARRARRVRGTRGSERPLVSSATVEAVSAQMKWLHKRTSEITGAAVPSFQGRYGGRVEPERI